jgi:hypothetical protein
MPRCARYLLGLALVLASCGQAPGLREAQDAFSQAATADNAARLHAFTITGAEAKGTAPAAVDASAGYARALALVKKLDDKQLAADNLLGTKLAIQAMSQWKLKDWDGGMASAQALQALASAQPPSSQVYPRDRALGAAMPALIRIDQAHDAIFVPATSAAWAQPGYRDDQVKQLDAAVAILDTVLASTTETDPVRVYLLQSELAAWRNKQDAFNRLPEPPGQGTLALSDSEVRRANCRIAQLGDAVGHDAAAKDGDAAVALWRTILFAGIGKKPDLTFCTG